MPGLMTNTGTGAVKTPSLGANMYSANSTDMEPVKRTVNTGTETVAGQMDTLTAKDSPLMTRARQGAKQYAHSRGLMNSSMAAGAGETAALDAALPIATADAGIHDAAARDNQAAGNTARSLNAAARNTAALSDAAAANSLALQQESGTRAERINTANIASQEGMQTERLGSDAALQTQRLDSDQALLTQQIIADRESQESRQLSEAERLTAQLQATAQLQTEQIGSAEFQQQRQLENFIVLQDMQTDSAKMLADIEANYKMLMQSSASAGQIMASAQAGINEILLNKDLSNDAKAALITKLEAGLKAQMGVIGAMAGLDIDDLLLFNNGGGSQPGGSQPGTGTGPPFGTDPGPAPTAETGDWAERVGNADFRVSTDGNWLLMDDGTVQPNYDYSNSPPTGSGPGQSYDPLDPNAPTSPNGGFSPPFTPTDTALENQAAEEELARIREEAATIQAQQARVQRSHDLKAAWAAGPGQPRTSNDWMRSTSPGRAYPGDEEAARILGI